MNVYSISKSLNGTEWTPVGTIEARSRKEAVLKAKRRGKSTELFWRTTIEANMSGRGLGRTKEIVLDGK